MGDKAAQLRTSAANWRSLATLLVILAGIGSFVYGQAAGDVAGYFGETDSSVVAITFAVTFLGALVILWPYFIMTRIMNAVADILESTPAPKPPAPPSIQP